MKSFLVADLKKLYIPPPDSHKGQNGKLLIIGGSHLFHAASLWALKVASRIVDMVFYSSVPENNEIVQKAKEEFRDGIVVRREDIESYIEEADCILIGPGMLRNKKLKIKNEKSQLKIQNLDQINKLKDEGGQTYYLTKYLLDKYPHKKWVIDAGSLQMMEAEWLRQLKGNVIVTPHVKEFERLFGFKIQNSKFKITGQKSKVKNESVKQMAGEYNCIILLKGPTDVVCSPKECVQISGGNAGMTKGGTGDVLAGLVAALSCKNDLFLAAAAGSFINKKAGESLFKRVGPYFNASDLADEIPRAMKELILT
ncbi:MAG: NAD(P)H-hydrate dehydratase [Candidatus Levybacteria bacterium]|nr:NAD(P)H-hydrate dehydratase [Candidatus Levybacteria bacterium]